MHFLLLCALEKGPTHFLNYLHQEVEEFECTVSKHFLYLKACTLFLCFLAERGFLKILYPSFGLQCALTELSILSFGIGFHILVLL